MTPSNWTVRRRVLVCAAAATLVLGACGGDDAGTPGTTNAPGTTDPASTGPATDAPDTSAPDTLAPATTTPETTTDPATTLTPVEDVQAVVFLVLDEQLVPVRRLVPGDVAPVEAAVSAWLAGPTAEEAAAGYGTAVPEGTRLLGVTMFDNATTVDLSGEFASGGGTMSVQFRLAELLATVITTGEARQILLAIDGQAVETLGGEGVMVAGPLTLDDVEDQLPRIMLTSVVAGDAVSNVLRLAGWANVFEGTVYVRVTDDQGNAIAETFVTATCGTGCRGSFSAEVELEEYLGPAVLTLFEVSPQDGREINVVTVPFTSV